MEELSQEQECGTNKDGNYFNARRRSSDSSEITENLPVRGFTDNPKDSTVCSSDEDAPRKRTLKRVKRFSDSDSDTSIAKSQNGELSASEKSSQAGNCALQSCNSESENNVAKNKPHKSRIQKNFSDSEGSEDSVKISHVPDKTKINSMQNNLDSKEQTPINSDNDMKQRSDSGSDNPIKNKEQQLRMKNKKNKLKDKFKNLMKMREKEPSLLKLNEEHDNEINGKTDGDSSNGSDNEIASIEKIKQKIKERMTFKSSICDPDTSDEESNLHKSIYKPKKERKTKFTSPKPQRMSAKQAMENMQKIKSESNRMLREKEVSLPYHRPKALSLKDMMSRRKLAISSDGKALPIKMNGDQLKQYAQMLEERQKEMMELCKSESEEEENSENPAELITAISNSEAVVTEAAENSEQVFKSVSEYETEIDNYLEKVTGSTSETQTLTDSPNHLHNYEQHELDGTDKLESDMPAVQNTEQILEEHDSENSLKLVYNDSADSLNDVNLTTDKQGNDLGTENQNNEISRSSPEEIIHSECEIVLRHDSVTNNTEEDSQLILHLDTENTEYSNIKDTTDSSAKESIDNSFNKSSKSVDQDVTKNAVVTIDKDIEASENGSIQYNEKSGENEGMEVDNEFSDDDINMEDIDNIIENAEIIKDIEDKVNSQFLVRDKPLNLNPKLTGAPGMVIDLDDRDTAPRKSGVELLKDRFTYFSKLKTPEEIERDREKKIKPGNQLNKLKQELEGKIAEQRSLEWAKRLEDEKQHQQELKELRGEESDEDDIDKIEAAIEEKEEAKEGSEESDSGEDEPIENDIEIKDKPRLKNAMVADEAEESDCDENEEKSRGESETQQNENYGDDNGIEGNDDGIESSDGGDSGDDESESDESSESEEENTVTKKGRILKAFEDSDEEDASESKQRNADKEDIGTSESKSDSSAIVDLLASQITSQDDEIQLAQRGKSTSDDLFTSQESVLLASETKGQPKDSVESDETFTQTFSILDSSKPQTAESEMNSSGKTIAVDATQSLDINNLDDLALCPVTDSQKLPLSYQIPTTQLSQSQPIGEDILALCTGQFYNNQFLSQVDNQPVGDSENYDAFENYKSQDSQEDATQAVDTNIEKDKDTPIDPKDTEQFIELISKNDDEKSDENFTGPVDSKDTSIELNSPEDKENKKDKVVDDNLKSILDELADPEFDSPKPSKFFVGSSIQNDRAHTEIQMKRKFFIDSDDEVKEGDTNEPKKRKKLKKKNHEKRALQISDDEEEQSEIEEAEEYQSDIEENNVDRLVEYDSEENEIEVKPLNPKKKRKMAEFFENEAELTSEDEWAGSGDEDEAGLDRMEREEGDDETFHQGKLQRELGQIHMREVLDQDKREVRLIQELLFEDGDLGVGGRQRKFKWNNMGDEETGTVPDEFADTQEEEFESEEQWRKQRHEREMFLRQMQTKDAPDDSLNVSVNRTTIIKANLLSKTMSSLLMEVNNTAEKTASPAVEKSAAKDIPSPKKPFALMQQSYQGSLLSRGRGALARLAALATPLAADDDAKVGTIGPNSRRNFVFAALTPEEKEPKVMKRRAESHLSTPKLVKKIRTEEKNTSKSSLLDHFKL